MATKSVTEMAMAAEQAAELLKALANEDRLMILCHLADGEKNVGEQFGFSATTNVCVEP